MIEINIVIKKIQQITCKSYKKITKYVWYLNVLMIIVATKILIEVRVHTS